MNVVRFLIYAKKNYWASVILLSMMFISFWLDLLIRALVFVHSNGRTWVRFPARWVNLSCFPFGDGKISSSEMQGNRLKQCFHMYLKFS